MNEKRSIQKGVFDGLITSNTRIRILMRLFLNPEQDAYLRELATEFKSSPSLIRDELGQLSDAGLLTSKREGRQIFYRANAKHTLFPELHSMVKKALGMDRIIDSIINRLGDLETAILIDDYASGKDTGLIDLVLVGHIKQSTLSDLVTKTEKYIKRKIRTMVMTPKEFREFGEVLEGRPQLVLWQRSRNPEAIAGRKP